MVAVYQAALDLLRRLQVHPEIAAQVLAYLFFFSGTLLLNQLLDKGEGGRTPGEADGQAPRGGGGAGPPGSECRRPTGLSWFLLSPLGPGPLRGGGGLREVA